MCLFDRATGYCNALLLSHATPKYTVSLQSVSLVCSLPVYAYNFNFQDNLFMPKWWMRLLAPVYFLIIQNTSALNNNNYIYYSLIFVSNLFLRARLLLFLLLSICSGWSRQRKIISRSPTVWDQDVFLVVFKPIKEIKCSRGFFELCICLPFWRK